WWWQTVHPITSRLGRSAFPTYSPPSAPTNVDRPTPRAGPHPRLTPRSRSYRYLRDGTAPSRAEGREMHMKSTGASSKGIRIVLAGVLAFGAFAAAQEVVTVLNGG